MRPPRRSAHLPRADSAHCHNPSASIDAIAISSIAIRDSTNQMKSVAIRNANSSEMRRDPDAHHIARAPANNPTEPNTRLGKRQPNG